MGCSGLPGRRSGDVIRRGGFFDPACLTELSALPKDERLGREEMTASVPLVAPARATAADFPSWSVVPTRGATHVDAIALEVQHRIVAAKSAHQLAEPSKSPGDDASRRGGCKWRCCRELLGVIGDHGRSPVPSPFMTYKV